MRNSNTNTINRFLSLKKTLILSNISAIKESQYSWTMNKAGVRNANPQAVENPYM